MAASIALLGCLALQRASAATLANVNWLSADLANAAFQTTACPERTKGDFCGVDPSNLEYRNDAEALAAVSAGSADFHLDCWSGASCAQPGLQAEPTGMRGVNALYASSALLEEVPSLSRIDGWRNATLLRRGSRRFAVVGDGREVAVYGSVTSWTISAKLHRFFEMEGLLTLNASIQHFETQEEMDLELQMALALHVPALFYYYEPTVLVSNPIYNVQRLEPSAAFLSVFPEVEVMKVRRIQHPVDDFLENFAAFDMHNAAMARMMEAFVIRASPALPDTNPFYKGALGHAARVHDCSRTGRLCQDKPVEVWPRQKDSSLPAQILVKVEPCGGFVDFENPELEHPGACLPNSTFNQRPGGLRPYADIDGYTVRHLMRVLENLGYEEGDVVFQCTPSTLDLIEHTAGGAAHIGASCITVTSERMGLVDFSSTAYATGLGLLVRTTVEHANTELFKLPFTDEVWIWLLLLITLVTVTVFILEKHRYLTEARRLFWRCRTRTRSKEAQATTSDTDRAAEAEEAAPAAEADAKARRPLAGDLAVGVDSEGLRISGRVTRASSTGTIEIEGNTVQADALQIVRRREVQEVLGSLGVVMENTVTMFLGRDGGVGEMKTPYGRCVGNQTVCFGILFMTMYVSSLTTQLTAEKMNLIDSETKIQSKTVAIAGACTSCSGLSNCTACSSMCPLDQHTQPRRHAVEEYVDEVMNGGANPMDVTRMCVERSQTAEVVAKGEVIATVADAPVAMTDAREYNDRVGKCELGVLQFTHCEYGYIFPKGSPLRGPVSEAVTHVNNQGIREELDNKYFSPSKHCTKNQVNSIGWNRMWVLFLIYIILVGASILACAVQMAFCAGWVPTEVSTDDPEPSEAGPPLQPSGDSKPDSDVTTV